MVDTAALYNATASKWTRREPNSLSDWTARPRVFDLCGDVAGKRIVDLGCGEGYCSRVMAQRGAARVSGIEISEKMVGLGKQAQAADDTVIDYQVGTVTALPFDDETFDLALGVFVYNYLDVAATEQSFAEVFRVLKPGGTFVFSVPHPSFPFIKRELTEPFYFDALGHGYFSSRDVQLAGKIWCRDGTALDVQMIPKSLDDYFHAFAAAGFTRMPQTLELGVTDEMIALDADFFSPLQDLPLHMAFRLEK